MQTEQTPHRNLGDLIVASCDLSQRIADDPSTAVELAARRLERVLMRGSNLRLSAAIAQLAREIGPITVPAVARRSVAFAAGR